MRAMITMTTARDQRACTPAANHTFANPAGSRTPEDQGEEISRLGNEFVLLLLSDGRPLVAPPRWPAYGAEFEARCRFRGSPDGGDGKESLVLDNSSHNDMFPERGQLVWTRQLEYQSHIFLQQFPTQKRDCISKISPSCRSFDWKTCVESKTSSIISVNLSTRSL